MWGTWGYTYGFGKGVLAKLHKICEIQRRKSHLSADRQAQSSKRTQSEAWKLSLEIMFHTERRRYDGK
jgi:hypothetical protein